MTQNFVVIGQGTSEITHWKKTRNMGQSPTSGRPAP